ncbi:MAG: FG-GAP-like repeat-containing protein [Deltaproteobacteria bacterium]|nr:FG-GAP-like repeat-containing protein [Deltaproteobacteria bacterium]
MSDHKSSWKFRGVRVIGILTLVLEASLAAASPVPFSQTKSIDGNFDGVSAMGSADIDGDGDQDVIALAVNISDVAWWENTSGDGSTWTKRLVDNSVGNPRWIVATDIDGDGDLDILGSGSNITWWENTASDGSVWIEHTIELGFNATFAASVWATDLDRDGDLDVLSTSPTPGSSFVTWWENTASDGSAWTRRDIDSTINSPTGIHAGDVDGDGDTDVIGGSFSSVFGNNIVWWENTAGDASAWTRRLVDGNFRGMRTVRGVDIDSDGDIDFAATGETGDQVSWWENTVGNGTAWTRRDVSTIDNPWSIALEDIDADGDIDLIGASFLADEITYWENTEGDGTAWTEYTIEGSFDGASAVAVTDLDGDGDLDVLASAFNTDDLTWWENETIHRSAAFPLEVSAAVNFGASTGHDAADIDGDGDLDLLGTSEIRSDIAWFENTAGDGSSWTEVVVDGSFPQASSVQGADIDGDGDLDVVGSAQSGALVSWWENTAGDGSTWTEVTIDATIGLPTSVNTADVDGDGDLDVFAVSQSQNLVYWWENTNGDGSFWVQHTEDLAVPNARSVRADDIDGDGDQDFVVASAFGNGIGWFENTMGDGSAWTEHPLPNVLNGQWASATPVDMDRDGDMDILGGENSSWGLAWWENTAGNGTTWTFHQVDPSARVVESTAADLDGDGDFDVLAAEFQTDAVSWWENAGDSTTWTKHLVGGSFDFAYFVSAADMDGDGALDVLGSALLENDIRWWRNRGGQFALPTTATSPGQIQDGATVAALEIEAIHRGRSGDPDAELTSIELLLEDRMGTPLTDSQVDDLLTSLSLYLDDGSGTFEPSGDTEIAAFSSFSLNAGVLTIGFAGGDANVQIPFGTPSTYFVVVELEATASSQSPDDIVITHLTESSSSGEDADHDLPISLEFGENLSSAILDANDLPVAVDDGVLLLEDSAGAGGNVLDGSSGGQDTDDESDPLTAALVTGPTHGILVTGLEADGSFSYQPNPNFNGIDSFTYTANDGVGDSNLATVGLTVAAVNDAPSFTITASHTSDEDASPQTVPGFASGLSPGPADEASQSLSFNIVGNTDPGLFATPPAVAADGTLTYAAAPEASGTATITLWLMDDGGTANGGIDTSASQSFDIVIVGFNDAPSGDSQSLETDEDAPFALTLTGSDGDPEVGQALTFAIDTGPSSGTLIGFDAALGTATYEPNPDFNGADSFTFTVTDDGTAGAPGPLTSTPVTIAIAINSINDAPSFAISASHESEEDAGAQTVPDFATGISAGATNESSQSLAFAILGNTSPSLFSVPPAVSADGTLTYTAAPDASGSATLMVQLMDDGGTANGGSDTSATQSFDIVVVPINDTPLAGSQGTSTDEEMAIAITLTGTDGDPEVAQVLTFAIDSNPGSGTLSGFDSATGAVTYQPHADFNGADSFTFTVSDDGTAGDPGPLTSAPATVTITVDASNDAPSFVLEASVTVDKNLGPQSFPDFATQISAGPADEADQNLVFSVTTDSNPDLFSDGPALASDGTLTFTTVDGEFGEATITVELMDDGGTANGGIDTSAPQDFTIRVDDVTSPTVVRLADSFGEDIEVCTELEDRVAGILVGFSEAMADPVGHDAPEDVTNPANYQLVASGPDNDFSTLACDALSGDDLLATVEGVSFDARNLEATVTFPNLLDDGIYRLFVCDDLEDSSGNPLAQEVVATFRQSAEQAFTNSQVDCDLDSWAVVSTVPEEIEYSTEDVDGSSVSGSVHITNLSGNTFALGQCIGFGSLMNGVSALVRIDGAPEVTVTVTTACDRFDLKGCSGTSLGVVSSQTVFQDTGGLWLPASAVVDDAGAESALCSFEITLDTGEAFDAYLDAFSLPRALFSDGFESGDTSAWTLTFP